MKYQTIIECPAGTDIAALPDVFQGLSALLELSPAISHRPMPATREYNGRMLIHMEVKDVPNIDQVMQFLATGIGAAMGQTWTVVAAQTTLKHKQYDAEGNPVMEDILDEDGVTVIGQRHAEAVNVSVPLSESYFLDFMPDEPDAVDAEGNVLTWKRPTVAAPHKMVDAEPWVLVA